MNDINQAMNNLKFLDEMAYKIGVTESSYLIYVNSDDSGFIPHFHYVDETSRGKDKKKGFHTCIRIKESEYFHHTGKEGVLNTKQRKELAEFMKQPFRNPKFNMTNWEFIVQSWNDNNSNETVDENQEMPDYTKLK